MIPERQPRGPDGSRRIWLNQQRHANHLAMLWAFTGKRIVMPARIPTWAEMRDTLIRKELVTMRRDGVELTNHDEVAARVDAQLKGLPLR